MWFKYVVKNIARKHGKTATFMPKPLFGDNGSGMHVHQSIWKEGKPLFGGDGYAGLSDTALHYIGGIIKHAKSIAGAHEPDDELLPAPRAGLRGAGEPRVLEPQPLGVACRIPITGPNPKTRRIEVRFPDPSCNPYLAFSAMLMAGLDGIQNKIDPGDPLDKDIYAPLARGAEGRPAHAGQPRRGARLRSRRTTSSCSAATSSRRTPSTSGSTSSGPRS